LKRDNAAHSVKEGLNVFTSLVNRYDSK